MASWYYRQLGQEVGPVSAQSLCVRTDTNIEVRRVGDSNWLPYFDALEQLHQEEEQDRQSENRARIEREEAVRRMRDETQVMEEARVAFYLASDGQAAASSNQVNSRSIGDAGSDPVIARAQATLAALEATLEVVCTQRGEQDASRTWVDGHLADCEQHLLTLQASLVRRVELQRLFNQFSSRLSRPTTAVSLFEKLMVAGVDWGKTNRDELALTYRQVAARDEQGRGYTVKVYPEVGEMVTYMKPDWSAAHGDHGTYEEATEFKVNAPQRIEIQ